MHASGRRPMAQKRPFLEPNPESVRAFIDAIPSYKADVEDPTFWPDDRLRDRQDELLRRQMGWLAEASPHYRELFERESIDAAGIKSVADLVRVHDPRLLRDPAGGHPERQAQLLHPRRPFPHRLPAQPAPARRRVREHD